MENWKITNPFRSKMEVGFNLKTPFNTLTGLKFER